MAGMSISVAEGTNILVEVTLHGSSVTSGVFAFAIAKEPTRTMPKDSWLSTQCPLVETLT